MKRLINREKLTLVISMVLVIAVLLSATVAWFMLGRPVSLRNLGINTDDKGDLYVWIKVEEDIAKEDMDNIMTIIHNNIEKANNLSDVTGYTASAGNLSYDTASAGNISLYDTKDTENVLLYDMASSGNLPSNTASSGNLELYDNYKMYSVYNLPTDDELRTQHFLPLKKVGIKDDVKYTIDMNIVEQDNIEKNTLAPGAYGKVELKILSMTELTTGYTITITPEFMGINEGFKTNGAGLTEEALYNLFKTHIKFYAVNEAGVYSKVIPYYDKNKDIKLCSLSGSLEEGVMKDVVLYWYWPYEYMDIPDLHNEDSPVYDEYEKYRNPDLTESERIEIYDWDDTYLGNYVEGFRFHFDVKGNR